MKSTSLTLLTSVLIGAAGLATSSARAQISAQDASNVVGTGDKAWSYLIVEGEDMLDEQRAFFEQFIGGGSVLLCDAIDRSPNTVFYRSVAKVARAFVEIEQAALDMK